MSLLSETYALGLCLQLNKLKRSLAFALFVSSLACKALSKRLSRGQGRKQRNTQNKKFKKQVTTLINFISSPAH